MDTLLIYSLKTGACLAVFYLFFKLLLSRDTFHRLNRIVVMAAVVLSFVLPFCVITIYKELPETLNVKAVATVEPAPIAVSAPASEPFPWVLLGGIVFIGGAVVMLSHTLVSICRVLNLVRKGRREKLDDGAVLVLLPQAITPFSWWKYIVMSEEDYAENGATIVMHERAHLRLHHSLDLIVIDIAGCLQWFNPAMWLLRREMRAIHEYEADEAVLNSGVDARQYQMLLIKKAAGGRWYSIANSFNHSKLKNRITMMLQTKSSRWACAKTLMVLPLTMLALGAFARTAYVVPDDKVKKENVTIHVYGTNSISSDGNSNHLFVVDGEIRDIASLRDLNHGQIKTITVLKGETAVERYGEQAKNGVIEITMKKEGDSDDAPMTVTASSTVPGTQTIVVEKGTAKKGEPQVLQFNMEGRCDSTGKEVQWVVNSEEMPKTSGTPVKIQTKHIILKDGAQLNRDSLITVVMNSQAATDIRLDAASTSVAFAKKVLESVKDKLSPEEWQKAQAELASAEKEIASAGTKGTPVIVVDKRAVRTIKNDNSDETIVVYSDNNAVNVAAGAKGTIIIKGDDVSSIKAGEEPLVVVDGKTIPYDELKNIDAKTIKSMLVLKDDATVKKYGKKAKYGVIEITTKK